MDSKKLNLVFASRSIGHQSEVWMWRQIKGFQKFKPYILTWDYLNSEHYSLEGTSLQIIPFASRPEQIPGLGRWIYRLKCIPYLNFYASIGAEQRFIKKLLLDIKPKVILCQFGHIACRMLPIAQKLKIPIVAHFHGLDLSASLKNNRWYRWSILPALKKFNAIIVVGNQQKKYMIERGIPKDQVHLIPCGIPTDFFKYKQRKKSKTIQFICVSRLIECKGLEYTIRAFTQVVKEVNNARMFIIGDGPLKHDLKALSKKLGLENCITFIGSLFPNKVREYLWESDIFLQHSIVAPDGWEEGFGISLAEAASTGLPVISTKCGGIPDQVIDGKTGFLIEQKDIHTMANRMLKLARDPSLREKMGKAGRKRMVAHFDIKKQIEKLELALLSCYKN